VSGKQPSQKSARLRAPTWAMKTCAGPETGLPAETFVTGSPTQSRLVASHNPPELRGTRPCPSRWPDGPLSHPPGLTGPALRAGPSKGVTRSNNGGQLLTTHPADEHRDLCSPLLRQPQGLAPGSLPDPQQRPAGPGPGPLIPNSTHRPGDTQNPPRSERPEQLGLSATSNARTASVLEFGHRASVSTIGMNRGKPYPRYVFLGQRWLLTFLCGSGCLRAVGSMTGTAATGH